MILDILYIALFAIALYQIRQIRVEHNARLTTLERREALPATKIHVQPIQQEAEKPKAGTVAAKAAKPVIFLGHVPHRTIELDNGCLEWEGKV